ncbi:MAG: hypothetical protein PHR77_00430 [Kiritimatiellae bacterium]|nr:hypothetical protein [Kiritimatiellia bacterium]MDD5519847.1 hypothetical protein [Kiritimatiellia bacterium]
MEKKNLLHFRQINTRLIVRVFTVIALLFLSGCTGVHNAIIHRSTMQAYLKLKDAKDLPDWERRRKEICDAWSKRVIAAPSSELYKVLLDYCSAHGMKVVKPGTEENYTLLGIPLTESERMAIERDEKKEKLLYLGYKNTERTLREMESQHLFMPDMGLEMVEWTVHATTLPDRKLHMNVVILTGGKFEGIKYPPLQEAMYKSFWKGLDKYIFIDVNNN